MKRFILTLIAGLFATLSAQAQGTPTPKPIPPGEVDFVPPSPWDVKKSPFDLPPSKPGGLYEPDLSGGTLPKGFKPDPSATLPSLTLNDGRYPDDRKAVSPFAYPKLG